VKTSVGFWDALFGERVTLEIRSPKGGLKKTKVTKKWIETMEAEGKMKQASSASQMNGSDRLRERAESLVQAAQSNGVAMFTPLVDRFPILRQADIEHSEFVLTVAAVFMAATRLSNLGLGGDREEEIMEVVAERVDQWRADGIGAFEDCKGLFESEFDRLTKAGHERRFVGADAVGKWIVWNILGHPPQTDEECMLVRGTGATVTRAFFDWWDE